MQLILVTLTLLRTTHRQNYNLVWLIKDPIIESATLASVSPTDIVYEPELPKAIFENGLLSAIQIENVIYACQAHERFFDDNRRAGFLIGDGFRKLPSW